MRCDGAYKELKPCNCHYAMMPPIFNKEKCSTWKCKRKVIAYEYGDYWCSIDLRRIKTLRKKDGRPV